MRIPKYWERTSRGGLAAWGWSELSREEALERAGQRLERIAEALRKGRKPGRYDYSADPIREQVIEKLGDADEPFAVVTRNGYGALILNTCRVAFVDIDLVEEQPKISLLSRLFGGGKRPSAKDLTCQRIQSRVNQQGGPSMRIYETKAGLRLLLTDQLYEPGDERTQELLRSFDCDPLYMSLCVRQNCFRARLTAKPWRLGLSRPPVRYPGENPSEDYLKWVAEYHREAENFAACRLLATLGEAAPDEEIRRVIEVHDSQAGLSRGSDLR